MDIQNDSKCQFRPLFNLTRSLKTLKFKVQNLLLDDGCYNEVSKTPTNEPNLQIFYSINLKKCTYISHYSYKFIICSKSYM